MTDLASGTVRAGVLFRLETSPPVKLWGGAAPLTLPADRIEDGDSPYIGAGMLQGLPAISQLVNGQAERVDFGISGAAVTSEVARLADDEAATVRGRSVWIGLVQFDDDWQIERVRWLWQGVADTMTITRQSSGSKTTRSVSLSVGSLFTFRRRARFGHWTDADQRRRSPDDDFCAFVAGLSQGTTKPAWDK